MQRKQRSATRRPPVTYDTVRELLEDAWRRVAPKRLIAAYDKAANAAVLDHSHCREK